MKLFVRLIHALPALCRGVFAAIPLLAATTPPAAVAASPAPARAATLDRIVAVVNDGVITYSELTRRVEFIRRGLQRQGTAEPPPEVLQRQVLDRMIIDMVQLQLAKANGIRVDDVQLDRTIERIAEQNKMSLAEFRNEVEKDGSDYKSFREDMRSEITVGRLREREIENAVNVTDAEVDAALAAEQARPQAGPEYRLQHILILVPDQATPQQIAAKQKRAEEALQRLKDGSDFAQVAAGYSESDTALTGGDLGWRSTERLPELFVDALKHMQDGEISSVLKSANGFHLIKLNERRSKSGGDLVRQTHVRHILLRPQERLSDTETRQRLEVLKARIESGSDFEQIARLQSQDGTASRGGDLGWVAPGETVPEFERPMDELEPGKISDPVRTPFGWHLIQVLERRTAELPVEKKKLAVRQTIRARKADEAYQEWLRQIRDHAFIENRLEEK